MKFAAVAVITVAASAAVAAPPGARAEMPEAIDSPGARLVATIHAEGAQIYECKADERGAASWQFREPIATLIADGKTVGRHFAGPKWELADGSAVGGKVIARAPGATDNDIPLLKLEVTSQRRAGLLWDVTLIQRLNTAGGALSGPCPTAGAIVSVPYAADYAFLQKKL